MSDQVKRDERLETWFMTLKGVIESLDHGDSTLAGRKIQQLMSALDDVRQFHQVENNASVKLFLTDAVSQLQYMIRLVNIKEVRNIFPLHTPPPDGRIFSIFRDGRNFSIFLDGRKISYLFRKSQSSIFLDGCNFLIFLDGRNLFPLDTPPPDVSRREEWFQGWGCNRNGTAFVICEFGKLFSHHLTRA